MVSDPSALAVPDVCLPPDHSERITRGNFSTTVYGAGNLEHCRKKLLPLLNMSSCKHISSSSATNCAGGDFQRPSISFINSKFYAFSEFYYTMEDILRMGGKYNSVRFQLAAQVCLYSAYTLAHNFTPKIICIQCTRYGDISTTIWPVLMKFCKVM